ncbi:helix-turn-helix domain-containing protein [Uliginosibacterium gangwonense]|uniref:helix-turn-helix domain-containing protein n=1 Tax=Uliginosibacterium gangwonense TaxID=392736 RepID=UPI0003694916|nr:helix-turn-helix domain-containing protein [Uliginosibacterium gangwonense]
MPAHRLAVVAFDRISAFHLTVPGLVFAQGERFGAEFDIQVCACEPGPLHTDAGFAIVVEHGLEAIATAQTVVVPSWCSPREAPPAALLEALCDAHTRGARIVGLCLGAYVLAAAGLLDGRRATTHWAYAQDFAQRFPKVEVDANVLYVDEGDLLTSAGTVAGIDCCLHLLRQTHGMEITNSVARRLVTAPHRQGGQAQFIEQPLPATAGDARLGELLAWVRRHLDQPHSLDSLAARALMSRRSFTRHFRQLTGTTVGDWLLSERLALSQRLLECGKHSIETIAQMSGFGAAVSLRHHFGRAFGVSPNAWRQTFRGE